MKLYNNIFRKLTVLVLLFYWVAVNGFQSVYSQSILQVATKSIEKTVTARTIRTLYINAEKADIELISWDKAEITVLMELSARHPDKRTAASDLGKIQYVAERSGKDYFLRNYILLREGESKPSSNLKARYTIHLPSNCSVDLKNTFGTIQMKGLTNNLKLSADFCTTSLVNIKGKGLLETTFGELKAIEISGTFSFTSDHTNLQLENIAGAIRMSTLYGNVEIVPSAGLTSLSIQSKKAVVTMITKNWQHFDYDINSAYTTMKLPNGFKWKRNTPDFKDAFFSRNQLANVQISTEFGNLTIK